MLIGPSVQFEDSGKETGLRVIMLKVKHLLSFLLATPHLWFTEVIGSSLQK